jgi:hypothetical protein
MQASGGKSIALIGFIGGVFVIRSLMSYEIRMGYLISGCVLILISVLLFIKQIRKIK